MKIKREPDGQFVLEGTEAELAIINNCINDATDLMSDGEFHARVGVEKRQAWLLAGEIGKQLDGAAQPQ